MTAYSLTSYIQKPSNYLHTILRRRLALVDASEPIGDYGLEGTYQFSRGEDIGLRRTAQGIVFQRAGKVSRLLSTPDRVDGTVSYSILEARIDEFNEAGIALDLYDLKAAVRRLRNDTPKLLGKLLYNAAPVVPANASTDDKSNPLFSISILLFSLS